MASAEKISKSVVIAQWIIICTILQAVIGAAVIIHGQTTLMKYDDHRSPSDETRAQVQSQAITLEHLALQENYNTARLDAIDRMELPSKLAVMTMQVGKFEQIMSEMRYVIYGIFISVVAGLIAQIFVIRGQSSKSLIEEP